MIVILGSLLGIIFMSVSWIALPARRYACATGPDAKYVQLLTSSGRSHLANRDASSSLYFSISLILLHFFPLQFIKG